MAGITETKEALAGAIELVSAIRRVGADGIQFKDAWVLLDDQELRTALKKAVDNAGQIPDEMSDLSFGEIMELFQAVTSAMKQLGS